MSGAIPYELHVATGAGLYHGPGYIAGEVPAGVIRRAGLPAALPLVLLARESFQIVETLWSAADGTYRTRNLKVIPAGYMLIATDDRRQELNAAVADLLTPIVP